MKYALNLAEDGRILSASFVNEYTPADAIQVDELPDGDIYDYRCVAQKFIYDPLPKPEQPEPTTPADESSVWDELDKAYQEGVDSI